MRIHFLCLVVLMIDLDLCLIVSVLRGLYRNYDLINYFL
jgi:hypothetical protein